MLPNEVSYASKLGLVASLGLGLFACSGEAGLERADADESFGTVQNALVLGDALPGTDPVAFAEASAAFSAVEGDADGVGPIFNERGCGVCHSLGAVGGAGDQVEQRFGRRVDGRFNSMGSVGGSLRQLFSIDPFTPEGSNTQCDPGSDDARPSGANVFAGRLTTPLFGLGLVDSLPDSSFDLLASRQPASIRGIVNRVTTLLPNPLDPSQSEGGVRVGRFGWKSNVSNLAEFSADAYLNEMGITTDSCINGRVNSAFAVENRANRAATNALIDGCPDDLIPGVDDSLALETNNCTTNEDGQPEEVHELQDDVALFTFFMANLAAPTRLPIAEGSAADRGRTLFNSSRLKCSGCHRSDADVFVSTAAGGVPEGLRFEPYSDFLVHDMGNLGDGIGADGDLRSVTRRMRTAPLWGLRFRDKLLHDGRVTSVASAIRAHDGGSNGQGTPAARAFNGLSASQKRDLVAFLQTL